MPIVNIQILTEHTAVRMAQEAQVALQESLMAEHRKGMHPYGSMRRECPLCQGR